METLAGATVAGTTAGVKAIATNGTNDARCGIQPASGEDRAPDGTDPEGTDPEGTDPGDAAPDTATPDTAADGMPRMAARRSTGFGWGRRRGIPARYEGEEGR